MVSALEILRRMRSTPRMSSTSDNKPTEPEGTFSTRGKYGLEVLCDPKDARIEYVRPAINVSAEAVGC